MGRKGDLLARLARIEGQVRGLSAMLDDEREVVEILTVLSSVRASLDRVGSLLLTHQVEEVLRAPGGRTLTHEQAAEQMEKVRKALDRYTS